ncbi:MAG: hypothetical protein IT385_26190 [Deltaproteobacteria bacterium]|nr:hypothetical protein [Deltaproteobacteria bacterium]
MAQSSDPVLRGRKQFQQQIGLLRSNGLTSQKDLAKELKLDPSRLSEFFNNSNKKLSDETLKQLALLVSNRLKSLEDKGPQLSLNSLEAMLSGTQFTAGPSLTSVFPHLQTDRYQMAHEIRPVEWFLGGLGSGKLHFVAVRIRKSLNVDPIIVTFQKRDSKYELGSLGRLLASIEDKEPSFRTRDRLQDTPPSTEEITDFRLSAMVPHLRERVLSALDAGRSHSSRDTTDFSLPLQSVEAFCRERFAKRLSENEAPPIVVTHFELADAKSREIIEQVCKRAGDLEPGQSRPIALLSNAKVGDHPWQSIGRLDKDQFLGSLGSPLPIADDIADQVFRNCAEHNSSPIGLLEAFVRLEIFDRRISAKNPKPEVVSDALTEHEREVLDILTLDLGAPIRKDFLTRVLEGPGIPAIEALEKMGFVHVHVIRGSQYVELVSGALESACQVHDLKGRHIVNFVKALHEEVTAGRAGLDLPASMQAAVLADLAHALKEQKIELAAWRVAVEAALDEGNHVVARVHLERAVAQLDLINVAVRVEDLSVVSRLLKLHVEDLAGQLEFDRARKAIKPLEDLSEKSPRNFELISFAARMQAYVENRGAAKGARGALEVIRKMVVTLKNREARQKYKEILDQLSEFFNEAQNHHAHPSRETLGRLLEALEVDQTHRGKALRAFIALAKEAGLAWSKLGNLRLADQILGVASDRLGLRPILEFLPDPWRRERASLATHYGWVHWRRGRHAAAIEAHQRALAVAGSDTRLALWANVGYCHVLLERSSDSFKDLEKRVCSLVKNASEMSDKLLSYNALYLDGTVSQRKLILGLLDSDDRKATDILLDGVDLANDRESISLAEKSLASHEAAIRVLNDKCPFEPLYSRYRLAELGLVVGKPPEETTLSKLLEHLKLDELIEDCQIIGARRELGIAYRIRAIARYRAGDVSGAGADFDNAIFTLDEVGDGMELARAQLYQEVVKSRSGCKEDCKQLFSRVLPLLKNDQVLETKVFAELIATSSDYR